MTALLARMRGAIASVVGGIVGTLVGPTTIAASNPATSTAYSNQRKIDRCQNGVLWAFRENGANAAIASTYYSTDDGATWTYAGNVDNGSTSTTRNYQTNFSLFIDLDDYAHIVFKDNGNGHIYYRRGTPNAARTAWTWSAAVAIWTTNSSADHPDLVAHREGTGWVAHVVYSYPNSTTTDSVHYVKVTIDSAGTIAAAGAARIGDVYGNTVHKWPSIDFNHTGDGKTVAGSTPHLYAAWSAGATGAGKGIRFKKATYSASSWTWGTEVEIDSTRYVFDHTYWLNCLFDGSRVVMTGMLYDGAASDLMLYERDVADTTTTSRTLADNVAAANFLLSGSATYDGSGNIHFIGRDGAASFADISVVTRKWSRADLTLGATTVVDDTVGTNPHVSAKRGYSENRIEFVYTDGTASPYNVNYGAIT